MTPEKQKQAYEDIQATAARIEELREEIALLEQEIRFGSSPGYEKKQMRKDRDSNLVDQMNAAYRLHSMINTFRQQTGSYQ